VDALEAATDAMAPTLITLGWQGLARVEGEFYDDLEEAVIASRLCHSNAVHGAAPKRLEHGCDEAWSYSARTPEDRVKAQQLLQSAYDENIERFGQGHPATWKIAKSLANSYAEGGDRVVARKLYTQLVDEISTAYGSSHPQTLETKFNIAKLDVEAGKVDEAESSLDDIIAAFDERFPESAKLSGPLTLRAEISLAKGELDRAHQLAMRAWSIQRDFQPPTSEERGSALRVAANVALMRRDPRTMKAHLDVVLSDRLAAGKTDDIADVLLNLGWLSCVLEQCRDVPRYLRQLPDSVLDEPAVAVGKQSLQGLLAVNEGDPEKGIILLEATLKDFQEFLAGNSDMRATTTWFLASAQFIAQNESTALATATQAFEAAEQSTWSMAILAITDPQLLARIAAER
jgi:hypothetical protein